MSAVLEYLTAEIMELAGEVSCNFKRSRIVPRHIQLAVQHDHEFREMFRNVTIASAGVAPNIHTALLPKKPKKATK